MVCESEWRFAGLEGGRRKREQSLEEWKNSK
jgi:hypothetical protein